MSTLTLTDSFRAYGPSECKSEPPIDTNVLFSRCMGNVSFALSLLGELQANGKQQVDLLFLHAAGDEWSRIAEVAHSLKGSAAILGADQPRALAGEVEEAAGAGEYSQLARQIRELRKEMDRCLAWIPTFRLEAQRRWTSTP